MAQQSPGKPHLGGLLVRRGCAPDLQTAIRQYITPGDAGDDRIGADMAIGAIRHAGGIAVWAHPLGGEGERRLSPECFEAMLNGLKRLGIQGMECFYSRYGREEAEFLLAQARMHGLLVAGGSDYHGANKTGIALGRLNAEDADVDAGSITVLHAMNARRGASPV